MVKEDSTLTADMQSGFQKGRSPFRWNSKNQEVFGVLFVKLSSHKKVSAGAGRVDPQIGFAR